MGKININRPVHLALRDRNCEDAMGLLKYAFEARPLNSRIAIINTLVERLRTAADEAAYALRGIMGRQEERDFAKFLKMLLNGARIVQVMTAHEELLQRDSSFLKRIMGENSRRIAESRFSHRNFGGTMMGDLKIMGGVAEKSYQKLKRENFLACDEEGQRRYQIMFHSAGRKESA
jgi:hypothetical protein